MESGVDNENAPAQRYIVAHRALKIALLLIAALIGGTYVNNTLNSSDIGVAMHMQHVELHAADKEFWPAYDVTTEALRKAAAEQPEGGAPVSRKIVELIEQQKGMLEKHANIAEAEFSRWDQFDVRHFDGHMLATRRTLNSEHSRVIRAAVADARKSAQLAYADIPTGPGSAVLVAAAAQDVNRISSYQIEARKNREQSRCIFEFVERRIAQCGME